MYNVTAKIRSRTRAARILCRRGGGTPTMILWCLFGGHRAMLYPDPTGQQSGPRWKMEGASLGT